MGQLASLVPDFERFCRGVAVIAAACLVFGRIAAQAEDPPRYVVEGVSAFAEGQWHEARRRSPSEFTMVFKPGWPTKVPVKVRWKSTGWSHPENPNRCQNMAIAPPRIVITRNGQVQPGQPTPESGPGRFFYEFANVPRSPPLAVNASCEIPGPTHAFKSSGGATISFHPQDPLHDWNPGVSSKPVAPAPLEIQKPMEGEFLPQSRTLGILVRGKFLTPYQRPMKLELEVERATSIQTGVVGDIALPGNQPYITWKAVKTLSLEVTWMGGYSLSQGSLDAPGHLFAEGGVYRVRLRWASVTPSPWRSFKVKAPVALRTVR